jgi:hypothetical protein
MRGTGCDGAGAAFVLPAQRTSMRMDRGLIGRVGEYVIDETQQRMEGP